MEKLSIGKADSIEEVHSYRPARLEVIYQKEALCPECNSSDQRIKASFWREIKGLLRQSIRKDD